jgi:hypothetical protein
MQHVSTILVDDLTGDEAAETVEFGLDGKGYEIDLSQENAGKLRDALGAYIGVARRTSKRPAKRAVVGNQKPGREQNQAIREWARSQGIQVSDRGRISAEVLAQFHDAHTKG